MTFCYVFLLIKSIILILLWIDTVKCIADDEFDELCFDFGIELDDIVRMH